MLERANNVDVFTVDRPVVMDLVSIDSGLASGLLKLGQQEKKVTVTACYKNKIGIVYASTMAMFKGLTKFMNSLQNFKQVCSICLVFNSEWLCVPEHTTY